MRTLLLSLLILTGCRFDEPYTWGDASYDVSQAFCAAMVRCEVIDPSNEQRCVKFNYFHFCELDQTCGDEVDGLESAAASCVNAIENTDGPQGCTELRYFLPDACVDFWNANPRYNHE